MASHYTGEFIYNIGGNNSNQNGLPRNFRQQQQQQQMGQQRVDLSKGKRSFSDFYYSSQQREINFLPQQLPYQQQQRFSYLQKLEQQQQLQNQYLIRSLSNNTFNNSNNNNNNNDTNYFNNRLTETYQGNNPTNNSFNSNNNNTNMIINQSQINGVGKSNPEYGSVDNEGDEKIKELEKILFSDDDDDDVAKEGVSDVTYSEWTVENFMNPSPGPVEPENNNSNGNVVTPSTGSSCCSPATTIVVPETVSVKQLVTETATAISEGEDGNLVKEGLSKLAEFGKQKGNSEERLVYYIGNALKSRALPVEYPPPVSELDTAHQFSAVSSLLNISPCFKLGLMAANLVMLDAITTAVKEGVKIVHLIDFDVSQDAQYVHLLRVLAGQIESSVQIKLTIVKTEFGNQEDGPDSVRDDLVSLAGRVGLNFKYSRVARAIHEMTRESIGCEEGEAIMVNFAFKLYRVPDESVTIDNLRDELLRRVKDFSPRAVTLIEQDLNGNTAPFMSRVAEAWGYYGALFDSLEAILPRDNLDRGRVEEAMGRKMGNLIACEGKDRVERAEVFGKWRARMGMAGFEIKTISTKLVETMRAKLDLAKGGNPGFTVKEENGGVAFGWAGRGITSASAWR